MSSSDLLGLIAATLTTLSFVPQAIKSVRTRDLSGISLGMYSAFTLGIALWLVYGIMTEAMPVIVANAVTLPLCGLILVLKLKEDSQGTHKAPTRQTTTTAPGGPAAVKRTRTPSHPDQNP